MRREQFTPSPEVLHLPTIFRRIQNGEIRVPAFQREFIWDQASVLKLFESVYKGYPIGSLLFWRVNERLLKIEQGAQSPFPMVQEQYPLNFILDGVQRLSTLYGVLHLEDTETPDKLNIVFDLHNEKFFHYDPDELPEAYIHLADLFSPKKLLKAQQALAGLDRSDELIEKSISLHASFQEYMVPVVTITRREVSEVVEIFERVNSSGLTLSTVDFMRAATWSENFDLASGLETLQMHASQLGYSLEYETLVKVLAIALDKAPTPDEMIKLRTHSARELQRGVGRAQKTLEKAIAFLKEETRVLSSALLPYEAQLLVIASVFNKHPKPAPEILAAIRAWFWSVSFSEGFRGKPDHYVVRAIQNAGRLAAGDVNALDNRFSFSAEDALERKLIRGTALSSAFLALFAAVGARSLYTGEKIPIEGYMGGALAVDFDHLIPQQVLARDVNTKNISVKVLANVVLASPAENRAIRNLNPGPMLERASQALGRKLEETLQSQFISPKAWKLLCEEDFQGFLQERAKSIYEAAARLSSLNPP